jgi:hypothetical protein
VKAEKKEMSADMSENMANLGATGAAQGISTSIYAADLSMNMVRMLMESLKTKNDSITDWLRAGNNVKAIENVYPWMENDLIERLQRDDIPFQRIPVKDIDGLNMYLIRDKDQELANEIVNGIMQEQELESFQISNTNVKKINAVFGAKRTTALMHLNQTDADRFAERMKQERAYFMLESEGHQKYSVKFLEKDKDKALQALKYAMLDMRSPAGKLIKQEYERQRMTNRMIREIADINKESKNKVLYDARNRMGDFVAIYKDGAEIYTLTDLAKEKLKEDPNRELGLRDYEVRESLLKNSRQFAREMRGIARAMSIPDFADVSKDKFFSKEFQQSLPETVGTLRENDDAAKRAREVVNRNAAIAEYDRIYNMKLDFDSAEDPSLMCDIGNDSIGTIAFESMEDLNVVLEDKVDEIQESICAELDQIVIEEGFEDILEYEEREQEVEEALELALEDHETDEFDLGDEE